MRTSPLARRIWSKAKNPSARQKEHHRKMSFEDELRVLLRNHLVEWDERYVWD